MNNFLRYWIYILCCLLTVGYVQAEENETVSSKIKNRQEELIFSFRKNLGFIDFSEYSVNQWNTDSLLTVLEKEKRFDVFFEFGRIVVKSRILKGEMRLAVVLGDRLYSKARTLNDPRALALALNTLGEVYAFTGKKEEAGEAFEKALELFNMVPREKEGPLVRILLLELTEYYLRIENFGKAGQYMSRLNRYAADELSVQAQVIRNIFNVYCELGAGSFEKARYYLQEVDKLPQKPMPGILSYYLIAKAAFFKKAGQLEAALDVYDHFFKMEGAKNNAVLYMTVMKNKAILLEKVGRKEEAFRLYYTIYAYINSVFEKNYPKEIDQLTTRFQAEQLIYQNERARHLSIRYYTIGIIFCVFLLLLLLFLSWRKIFRLRQSKIKLETMQQKAVEAIQRKNLFLSNMSHEVRTPLNAIVGFSGLLASGELGEDEEAQREYCEIIKVNSRQLLKLINDILDFSDFEGDNIKFHIKEYDAVKICREVVETVLASYQVKVSMRFETDLPALPVETDDARLRQVLINLLVNAAKFTSEGAIVLKLELCPEDPSTALFSVTDTGCGIPFEKQKLIFERFEKLNNFVQGSGLGLSICRLIITRIHGKLWVDPEYTKGTRFYFTHPLKYESVL